MKGLLFSTTFTLIIILLYQFVDINLFTIDLPRRVSSELFKSLREDPEVETSIVLLDAENLPFDTVMAYIEILETLKPRSIGINLCNTEYKSELLKKYFVRRKNIIICDCDAGSNTATSAILAKNEVTHFKTDKPSYFELQLAEKSSQLKERGNNRERINFRGMNMYYRLPLNEVEKFSLDIIKDQTVLIGFMRESLVTPMNERYGQPGEIHGDMSDVQFSANIISTINKGEFINDVNLVIRVLLLLAASLICTGLIRLLKTKSALVNIILGLVILVALSGICSHIIVLAFSKHYYLDLNEMTVVLIISAIVSIYWNTNDRTISKPVK